jgi:hypothetical protein
MRHLICSSIAFSVKLLPLNMPVPLVGAVFLIKIRGAGRSFATENFPGVKMSFALSRDRRGLDIAQLKHGSVNQKKESIMGQDNRNQGSTNQKPQPGQAGRDVNTSSTSSNPQRDQQQQRNSSTDQSRQSSYSGPSKKDI